MPKKKNVRVALEGATIDGRNITRDQIQQMADNYDPDKKYGARIWMEHMRGFFPDSAFRAYGDVLSLKAEEVDGKLGLYAEIDPTDDLVSINQQRQKVYTSIELNPNFADSGEAYLMGLAVTDTPASQGTQMLQFSLQANKVETNSLYSEYIECDFSEDSRSDDDKLSLLAKVQDLFSRKNRTDKQRFHDVDRAVLDIASETVNLSNQLDEKAVELSQLRDEFNALKDALDKEETSPPPARKLAAGHDTKHHSQQRNDNDVDELTDC